MDYDHAAGGVGKGVGKCVVVVVACWSRVAIELSTIAVDLFQPVSHKSWVVGAVVVVVVVVVVVAEGREDVFVNVDVVLVVVVVKVVMVVVFAAGRHRPCVVVEKVVMGVVFAAGRHRPCADVVDRRWDVRGPDWATGLHRVVVSNPRFAITSLSRDIGNMGPRASNVVVVMSWLNVVIDVVNVVA